MGGGVKTRESVFVRGVRLGGWKTGKDFRYSSGFIFSNSGVCVHMKEIS